MLRMSMVGNTFGIPEGLGTQQTDRASIWGDPTDLNPLSISLVIILQAQKDVIASNYSAPISTKDLQEYIAIKFNSQFFPVATGGPSVYSNKFRGQLKITNTVSIWTTSKDPFSNFENPLTSKGAMKENIRLIDQVELPDDVDIVDGEQHSAKIEYDKDVLKIFIDQYSEEPILASPIRIGDSLELDNGSCYIGIAQETFLTNNIIEIFNWSLMSTTQSFSKDSWSGLSLEYKVQWPIHLFLSPTIIESYNKLFRFLFPLRRVQIDLQNDWNNLKTVYDVFEEEQMRFIMAMRAKLSNFINNVMSYLQLDVIETQWGKLSKGIEKCEDFEEARKLHENYLSTLSTKFFLSMDKIIKIVQDISHLIMRFSIQCKLIVGNATVKQSQNMDVEGEENEEIYKIPKDIFKEINEIKEDFNILSKLIFKILSKRKGTDNSTFLSQLF